MLFLQYKYKSTSYIKSSQYLKVTDKAKIMSNNKIDYYTLLDVPKSATQQQIKKAYKKLAIKWHPDKNPDNKDQAVQKFRDISEAYQTLSNEQKRKKYDLYGFNGEKFPSSAHHFDFSNASDLFKSFFKTYGFDNASDNSFFDNYFKSYSSGGGSGSGTTYYKYSSKPSGSSSGTSSYSSYFSKPSQYTTANGYTTSSGNTYRTAGNTYTSSGNTYTSSGNTYTSGGNTYKTYTTTGTDNDELPPEGQTIKKVAHVTRKFTNGTQQTIKITTIISSDGSKQITEQNLDGTNKKTYFELGGKTKTTETKAESPPKSSNFSGYNFGKRQSTTTADSGTADSGTTNSQPTAQKKEQKTSEKDLEDILRNLYGRYSGNSGSNTYYTSSGSTGGSYKIPSDMYANITRTYSGGTKVYYADGTEATNAGSFYGGSGSYGSSYGDSDKTRTKVYYTVRK